MLSACLLGNRLWPFKAMKSAWREQGTRGLTFEGHSPAVEPGWLSASWTGM